MGAQTVFLLLLSLLTTAANTMPGTGSNQSEFFSLMKASLSGNALSSWDVSGGISVCNLTGIGCNSQGYVEKLDMTGWSVSGRFPTDICTYLPKLKTLLLSSNNLHGDFLYSLVNCSLLEELNLSFLHLTGKIPDLSGLTSLKILDMSYNQFTGEFPVSIFNLTNLEEVNFNENDKLNLWKLPGNISRLTNLKSMILATCMLHGPILAEIGKMTSLVDLELSGNFLSGPIPPEIGLLKNLQQLELYYNFDLSGPIPEEIGNLTELVDLDASVNKFTTIPESICRLPKLEVLQLYNSTLTGGIPRCLGESTTLRILSLYSNNLTGEVPENLGQSSAMTGIDLSENFLSGPLPPGTCKAGKLMYFLVLQNKFSGQVPNSYAECSSLIRFRVNNNHLEGPIPEGLFGLPHVSIIDLSYNNFSGPISKKIGNARNLSELLLQSNKFSGAIPPEISRATNLVKIYLSNNILSGPIPSKIGYLRKLNELTLKGNRLNSSIPNSLSLLKSLDVLDLSNNLLTGSIPPSLCELSQTSIDLSYNLLSGPIPDEMVTRGLIETFSLSGNPGLCVTVHTNQNFAVCPQTYNRKKLNSIWAITISVFIIVLGALLLLKRQLSKERAILEHDEMMSSSFFSYDIKSFHRLSFNPREILESMIDKNMVGQGGSGRVYKVELSSGEVIAVKRLWSKKTKESASEDQLVLDKALKTEVETLGSIRHKNIVKLYSYFSNLDCSLLVYEYMPNGNLWEALHKGSVHLSWPIRHQIALGVAQGLAYLHHDLMPPIIHRDIKSTNILLDANYQPKVADFGIAKVLQARGGKDSTTTVIAGTYGYLAPEYAYTSKATTKCDVYSFGVVLMELITGKKLVEEEFGENKNIIYWVSTKLDSKDGVMEVLDKRLSETFGDEMIRVLQIAIRCTSKTPTYRPTMNEVVQLLIEADPRIFTSCKSLDKTKEASSVTKIKNQSEL